MWFRNWMVVLVLPMMIGCSGTGDDVDDSDRSPISKADLIGSCHSEIYGDHCGDKSDGNCWCDEFCEVFGDCCDDYEMVCSAEVDTSLPDKVIVEMGYGTWLGQCPEDRLCTFFLELTDPWEIRTVVLVLRGQSQNSVLTGKVRTEPASYNENENGELWSWHIDVSGFSRFSPEVCDTGPDLLENAVLAGSIDDGHKACFWSFTVVGVHRADGTAISATPQGRKDCEEQIQDNGVCPDECVPVYLSPASGKEYICEEPFFSEKVCPEPGALELDCGGIVKSY
jgi:hypothetical protein